MGEDLGGAGRPLSEGSPYPPNLPDPPRTSPKSTRPCRVKIGFALYRAGAPGGSFWFWREVQILYMARLRTRFVGNRCSALVQGIPTNRFPPAEQARQPHFAKNTFQNTKTSPESTRSKQNESNLCHAQAGALGGSSR